MDSPFFAPCSNLAFEIQVQALVQFKPSVIHPHPKYSPFLSLKTSHKGIVNVSIKSIETQNKLLKSFLFPFSENAEFGILPLVFPISDMGPGLKHYPIN